MVKFTLDEDPQEYVLEFDFNELADAEPVTSTNLMAAIASWPSLSCRQMRALLYALLKKGHPEVLLTEAGDLLSRDTQTVYAAIKQALAEASLLEAENPQAEAPAPPAPQPTPIDSAPAV